MSIEIQGQPQRLGEIDDGDSRPPIPRFPEDWTLSESWQRAQTERDRGSAIGNLLARARRKEGQE